jgi:hypothetical protein
MFVSSFFLGVFALNQLWEGSESMRCASVRGRDHCSYRMNLHQRLEGGHGVQELLSHAHGVNIVPS